MRKKGNKYYFSEEKESESHDKFKITNICPMNNGNIFYVEENKYLFVYVLTDRYLKK